jgi:hypothetical protein
MVNNLEAIKPFLDFRNGTTAHVVTIIARKKDIEMLVTEEGVNIAPSSRAIKQYFIRSMEQFDTQFEEMKIIAEAFNARVMINLSPFNLKEVHGAVAQAAVEAFVKGNHEKPYKHYGHFAMTHSKRKWWIVDLDDTELASDKTKDVVLSLRKDGAEVEHMISSKSGVSILISPYDSREWEDRNPQHQIKKAAVVNLYIPEMKSEFRSLM